MDNNKPNPATGNKGTFPGSSPNVQPSNANTTGAQNMMPQTTQMQQEQQVIQKPKGGGGTYFTLQAKDESGSVTGVIEIDLISFRERGEESRFLSINVDGSGVNNDRSTTKMSIGSEEEFNRLKEFISQLSWND